MTHVVTEACFGCKHTECVTECPTDSFREGENMLFIDPDSCIDCYQCQDLCPEGAIFEDGDVPEHLQAFIELNAEMSVKCPEITEKRTT